MLFRALPADLAGVEQHRHVGDQPPVRQPARPSRAGDDHAHRAVQVDARRGGRSPLRGLVAGEQGRPLQSYCLSTADCPARAFMGQASAQSISCGTRNNFIMSSFVERECIVVGDCTVLSMYVCVSGGIPLFVGGLGVWVSIVHNQWPIQQGVVIPLGSNDCDWQ